LTLRCSPLSSASAVALLISLFVNATPPTEIYTLSLHDALPISDQVGQGRRGRRGDLAGLDDHGVAPGDRGDQRRQGQHRDRQAQDRKSTRLNSSHVSISYAVFCLKKKRTQQ